MTPTDLTIASGVLMTVTTIIRRKRRNQGQYMVTVVYGFAVTLALLLISIVAPLLARVLAYLGMAGAIAVNGPDLWKLIAGLS